MNKKVKILIKILLIALFTSFSITSGTVNSNGNQTNLSTFEEIKQSPQNNSTISINPTWSVVTDQLLIPSDGKEEDAFNVAVIGDSIAWGNGLYPIHKYYYQVAQWLHKALNRPICVKIYAHSGAIISGLFCKPINPALNHDCPSLATQADSIQNPDKVDLILVSGGINDVGLSLDLAAKNDLDILNLINYKLSPVQIRQSSQVIEEPMKKLLINLLSKNNKLHIIVTNYYPIVSSDTSAILIYALQLLQKDFSYDQIKAMLKDNSDIFYLYSTKSLDNAVKQADNGANRIAFAKVNFLPINCYGTGENSWLWAIKDAFGLIYDSQGKVTAGTFITNDEMFEVRLNMINPKDMSRDAIVNRINAVAHPNVLGAAEYARAIEYAITNTSLGKATLQSPSGTISTITPTFTWSPVYGATQYCLILNGPSGNILTNWYTASAVASGASCSITPSITLQHGSYTLWIQASNDAGNSPLSDGTKFTINSPPTTPSVQPPSPISGIVGNSYAFTAKSNDPDNDKIKYTFYWDDAKDPKTITDLIDSGVEVSKSHAWNKAGTYHVTVMATDSYGASSGLSSTILATITSAPATTNVKITVIDANTRAPIQKAQIVVTDSSGNSKPAVTTGSNGQATITVVPGTWKYQVSASYYKTNTGSWSITSTTTSEPPVSLQPVPPSQVTVTFTVENADGTAPIPYAKISIKDGANTDLGQKTTDNNGQATFTGAPGTWTVTASATNYNDYKNSWQFTASTSKVINLNAAPPSQVTVTFTVENADGTAPIPYAKISIKDGANTDLGQKTTDNNGQATFTGAPGTWTVTASATNYNDYKNSWQFTASTSKVINLNAAPPSQVTVTFTVENADGTAPIPYAKISIKDGANTDLGQKTTDNNGQATFTGAPGTWTVTASANFYNTYTDLWKFTTSPGQPEIIKLVEVSSPKIQAAVIAAKAGDTINVPAGIYTENVHIDKPLTINGAGSLKTFVDGGQAGSVFTIDPNIDVTLSNMYIKGGSGTYDKGDYWDGTVGGGIYNKGRTTVKDCYISSNDANYGAGVFNNGGIFTMESGQLDINSLSNDQQVVLSCIDGGGVYNYQGTFTMNGGYLGANGAKSRGGGVLNNQGIVTMNNGTITGNSALGSLDPSPDLGGGGGVFNWGTFNMNGGSIYYNGGNRLPFGATKYGGGVDNWGTFTMNNGTISNNGATERGGGVDNQDTFTMNNGNISGNTVYPGGDALGGGIYNHDTTFTMEAGAIYGNKVGDNGVGNGGGIYNYMGTITMDSGTISKNIAANCGGGVYDTGQKNYKGTFTMNNGAISGNSANSNGGGLYYDLNAVFAQNGGTISGNSPDNVFFKNWQMQGKTKMLIPKRPNMPKKPKQP